MRLYRRLSFGETVARLVAFFFMMVTVSAATAREPERGPEYPAPADTVLVEAHSMRTDGPGWQVKDYSVDDGYYGYPLDLKLLWGKPGAMEKATANVTMPHPGKYRVWIRCLENRTSPYVVTVTQNSKEVARMEFNDKTPGGPEENEMSYKGRAFIWWSFDADLGKGPCTLQLTANDPVNSPGPWIDCMAMTSDMNFTPYVWCFAKPLYIRFVMGPKHNKLGGVAFYSGRIDSEGYFCGRGHITKQGYDQVMQAFDDHPKKFLYAGDVSAWANIGPSLDPRGVNHVRFDMMSKWPDASPTPAYLPDSDFTVEIALTPGGNPVYRGHREGKGSGFVLLIDPRHPEQTKSNIEWSALRLKQALDTPIPLHGKAPTIFPSFTGLNDFDESDPEPAIQNDLLTLRALGFTGSTAVYHNPKWMKEHGMIYNYLSTFMWGCRKQGCLSEPEPEVMRDIFTETIKDFYTEMPQALYFRLMDEIYSMDVDQMKTCPGCVEKFHDYLRAQGLQPSDLLGQAPPAGQDPWQSIEPTEDMKTSPALFYYTQLFREQILTDFLKTATTVLQQVEPGIRTAANASIEMTSAFNGLYRGADLFAIYKSNALTYGFTEDANGAWPSGQTASFAIDIMRSACKYNHQPYATYTISTVPPQDTEAKAFDELGHGVRFVHFYDYGPFHSDASDPMSNPEQYFPAWKEFNYAVGSVENDLYDAQAVPSRVALLYSPTTDIWTSTTNNITGSGMERVNLYLLLRHLGYAVDILTEDDVLEGRADDYGALFTSESHFKDGVVAKLLDWTQKGGFLYAGAGAGRFGKYNEPVPGFEAAGLKLGPFSYKGAGAWWPQDLDVVDKIPMEGKTVDVAGGKESVAPDSAGQVVLKFADGTPCATQITYGKGHLLYLGFFPGTSYVRLANLKETDRRAAVVKAKKEPTTYCASWFPEEYRQLMQNLLKPMGINPVVHIDNYLVEGNLLQGKHGQILALANWNGHKQTIHVTVDLPYSPGQPRAAINTLRDVKRQGNAVSFALDLGPGNFVVLPASE